MHISDEALIVYLKKNERKKRYSRGRGAGYMFRLEHSSRPTERMRDTIVFFSPAWEKEHEIAASFAMECLDRYNSGSKNPDDFVAKAGARSPSRRGRYFCELLRDVEAQLRDSPDRDAYGVRS